MWRSWMGVAMRVASRPTPCPPTIQAELRPTPPGGTRRATSRAIRGPIRAVVRLPTHDKLARTARLGLRALASSPTPQRRERVETFPDRVGRAGARWRPGRRSGIALVVIAPLAGSAIGGGLAARTTPERAEAVVVVGAGSGPSDANRAAVVRAVVALARTPAMAAAAQEIAASSGERLLAPASAVYASRRFSECPST